MPPKASAPDTPSPSKKRKIETPVKKGVDFFFKKQLERNQPPAFKEVNGHREKMYVLSDDEELRRKQEEEDEKLAKELQDLEGRMGLDDEEFARRLARDYDQLDKENGTKHSTSPKPEDDDVYGEQLQSKPKSEPVVSDSVSTAAPPTSILETEMTTPLEEIYSIPLDKDPLAFDPATDASCASTWSVQKTPYAFLTHSFILINSTRSRLKITDYLVNTLRVIIHHDPSSLLPLVWLTTNAIAPPFEGIELGLGGAIISKALKSASGITPSALKALYDKHGDMGDVAFEAKMSLRTLVAPKPLTVKGVYGTLRSIARAKGQGSAETKRRLVERLLVSAKGEEVRYIGRTLVQHVFSHTTQLSKI